MISKCNSQKFGVTFSTSTVTFCSSAQLGSKLVEVMISCFLDLRNYIFLNLITKIQAGCIHGDIQLAFNQLLPKDIYYGIKYLSILFTPSWWTANFLIVKDWLIHLQHYAFMHLSLFLDLEARGWPPNTANLICKNNLANWLARS